MFSINGIRAVVYYTEKSGARRPEFANNTAIRQITKYSSKINKLPACSTAFNDTNYDGLLDEDYNFDGVVGNSRDYTVYKRTYYYCFHNINFSNNDLSAILLYCKLTGLSPDDIVNLYLSGVLA